MAAKKAVQTEVETPEHITEVSMIPVASLLGDKNTRFSLKKSRIEDMADSIIDKGGIMEPLEVEPLSEEEIAANPGKEFRVVFGHYRLAGAEAANSRGYAFEAPCIVKEPMTDLERTKRQVAENLERENPSPIDKAVAIKALLNTGLTKQEVREVFRTSGGRKGLKSQPASNSFINMTLSFLELPKKIVSMIHEGEIGVADAYFLTKLPEDKREPAVEKAVAARLKELEQAEEDENKFLQDEAKKVEAETKAKEAGSKLEEAKAKFETAVETAKAKAEAAGAAIQAKILAATDKEKAAAAADAHKAAEKEALEAQKTLETSRKELQKLTEKAEKQTADATARAVALQAAKDRAKADAATKKPLQVAKSAAVDVKNKANTDGVPITFAAIKKTIDDLALPGSYAKVSEIGKAFKMLYGGRMSATQLVNALAVITSEKSEKATPAKEKK